MRVIVFASGSPLSIAAADTVAKEHRLLAVVAPRPAGSRWSRIVRRHRSPGARLARRHGARLLEWPAEDGALQGLRPDLLVIASFPHLIPEATLAAATLVATQVTASTRPPAVTS